MTFSPSNFRSIDRRGLIINEEDYAKLEGTKTLAELGLTIIHPMYNNLKTGSLEEVRLKLQFDTWIKYSRFVRDSIKILLVDDGSPEPIASVLERPSFLKRIDFNLDIWRIKEDLLYNTAGALNLGITKATTEWVLIMDSDCLLDTDTMERLLRVRLPDKEHWNYRFTRKRITKDKELAKNTVYLPCSMLIKKSTVMALHGFDEDFSGSNKGGYGFFDNHFNHKRMVAGYPAYVLGDYIITEHMHETVGRVFRGIDPHYIGKSMFRAKQRGEIPESTDMLRFEYEQVFSKVASPSTHVKIETSDDLIKHGTYIRELGKYRGWIHEDEGKLLLDDVKSNKYKVCYEAGTRRGWSAAWMALGGAEVHTWDIAECCERLEYNTSLKSKIKRYIMPFDKGVISVLENRPDSPVLIHIDGDHSYAGIKADFDAVTAFLKPGDAVWFNDTVTPAFKRTVRLYVEELAKLPQYNVTFFPTKYGMARLCLR